MTTFQPGEIVDITIKGARVKSFAPLAMSCTVDGYRVVVYRDSPEIAYEPPVIIERVAPAGWPPQPGDLWRDKHDALWFIYQRPAINALGGRTANGARWTDDATAELLDACGPLTLVRREGGAS